MIGQFDSYLIENDGYNPKNEPFVYRCRRCNNNLSSNDPASQYQRQKIIQKTVRVMASVFTMNLGALSAYERPNLTYNVVDVSGSNYLVSPGVNWNQMSDRREPHIQVVKNGAGSGYHSSSTKRTITSNRPGAMSPGGAGVDIKHNSYDRYLNRLKGKGPLRRGPVPPAFGSPYIPFNRAFPVYGGKTIKTSIVGGCDCPITDTDTNENDNKLYANSNIQYEILNVTYKFNIGDFVWARRYSKYEKATIINISNGLYTVKFADGTISVLGKCDILIYYNCGDCSNTGSGPEKEINYAALNDERCYILTALSNGEIL